MKPSPKKIIESVVSQLLAERKKQRLSHDKVAELAGINRSTISLIESRKREATLMTLVKIATALKCSLGDILLKAEKESKK